MKYTHRLNRKNDQRFAEVLAFVGGYVTYKTERGAYFCRSAANFVQDYPDVLNA